MEQTGVVLPEEKELCPEHLGFLDEHFRTHQDLSRAPHFLLELQRQASDLDTDLANLQRSRTKLAVSWISRSFAAKKALHNLNSNLHNLASHTSQHGIGLKTTQKVLGEELPRLAKELRRIETIRSYVETTLKLEALVGDLEDATHCVVNHQTRILFTIKSSNSSSSTDFGPNQEKLLQAIKALNNIEELLVHVAKIQPQWHQLLKSVDTRVDKNLSILRPQVLADHRALLTSLGWPPELSASKIEGQISDLPNPLMLMQGDKRKSYSHSFLSLCAMQHLQARRVERQLNLLDQKWCHIGLWAIDELVSSIAQRMEYHFSKWAEQPEFMFTLVYKITRDFIIGVDDVLQPLIDKARLVSCSAKEAWVSAMVQVLSGFLAKRVFPALAERYKEKHMRSEVIPSWLHLIDLMVTFDKRVQSLVSLETCLTLGESARFEGLSRGISVLKIFCDRTDWFKIWATIELKDACRKLKAELRSERAWLIENKKGADSQIELQSDQFFLSTRENHNAPLIAESAVKITWETIERCQSLPATLPRIKFIRSTAARFLWYFFNILLLRCERTELSFSSRDDALMRVCGSINAARYVLSKMQEWSEDVNFLEMKIAENDSNIQRNHDLTDHGCFFGEEIKSLAELETNWLMETIAALLREFETLSWEYVRNNKRFEHRQENLTLVSATMDLAISAEFVEALDALRRQLCVIKLNLNPKDFLDLWRSVANGLDHFIFCSILTSDFQFSGDGINQFGADMQALFLVFQPFCARPEAFFPCIRDSLKLFKMSKEEVNHLQVVLSGDKSGINSLHFCGIFHISFDHVAKVLRNRKF